MTKGAGDRFRDVSLQRRKGGVRLWNDSVTVSPSVFASILTHRNTLCLKDMCIYRHLPAPHVYVCVYRCVLTIFALFLKQHRGGRGLYLPRTPRETVAENIICMTTV